MRKIVAWPLFYFFYYLGDLMAKVFQLFPARDEDSMIDRMLQPVFDLYQWAMGKSLDIDEWADLKQWQEPTDRGTA